MTPDDAWRTGRPRDPSHSSGRALLAAFAVAVACGAPGAAAQSSGGFVGGTPSATTLEQVDPAVRRYESDRCVRQRARGWGGTGDCDHPAYSGSGAPVIIVTPPPRFGGGAGPEHREPPPRQRPAWAW